MGNFHNFTTFHRRLIDRLKQKLTSYHEISPTCDEILTFVVAFLLALCQRGVSLYLCSFVDAVRCNVKESLCD